MTMLRQRTSKALVAAIAAAACLAAAFAPGVARAEGGMQIEEVSGYTTVAGRTRHVTVLLRRSPGTDPQTISARALGAIGAQAGTPSTDVFFLGSLWPRFFDRDRQNDVVVQSYNPAGDPTGAGLTSLQHAQATWNGVEGSTFRFGFGGVTARVPSLSVAGDCPGAGGGELDGSNDVGWCSIGWDDPSSFVIFGYAAYEADTFTGETLEADVVLNTDIAPSPPWSSGGGDTDVETVILHELGHVLGLSHTVEAETAMFFALNGTRRTLSDVDADGARALYPRRAPLLSDEPRANGMSIVAERGDRAPGGGIFTGSFEPGAVNARGETAFVADVAEGQALVVAGRDGPREVVRSGQVVGGVELGAGSNNAVGLNDAGDVAFAWYLLPFDPSGANTALFRTDAHGRPELLVRPGVTPAPGGGVFAGCVNAALSARGDVVFAGLVDTDRGRITGIFVTDRSGAIRRVAAAGDLAPGGGTFTSFSFTPSISSRGTVAFAARTAGVPGLGVYVQRAPGGTLEAVARPGLPAPGGKAWVNATQPRVNGRGEILFGGMVDRPGRRVFAPYLARGASIAAVAELGEVLPDGWTFDGLLVAPGSWTLNEAGDVGFVTRIRSEYPPNEVIPFPTIVDATAVYASSGGQLGPVAREGDVLLGLGWIWSVSPGFFPSVLLDDRGDVVFQAETEIGRLVLLRAGRRV